MTDVSGGSWRKLIGAKIYSNIHKYGSVYEENENTATAIG